MLVLTRKVGEQVVVPHCQLTLTVLEVTPSRVRLGITAPPDVAVHRGELGERLAAATTSDVPRDLRVVRVLIADRDQFLLAAYGENLREQGAIVAAANSGLACVERLRDFAPDVLVLDPTLPWGGGDGVLAMMYEEPEIRPALVLLLTPGTNRSLLYRLSSFKVDDFQAKPVSPGRLLERICMLRARCRPGMTTDVDAWSPQNFSVCLRR